jgi:hypothetical protein
MYSNTPKSSSRNAFIETQTIVVGDEAVTAFWAENIGDQLKFNRDVPSRCPYLPEDPSFVVDTRKGPPESYAKPGEMGYFAVAGDFVLTKIANGEHVSLSDRAIKTFSALLALPKCARCKVNPLAYRGAVYCGAACSEQAEAGE